MLLCFFCSLSLFVSVCQKMFVFVALSTRVLWPFCRCYITDRKRECEPHTNTFARLVPKIIYRFYVCSFSVWLTLFCLMYTAYPKHTLTHTYRSICTRHTVMPNISLDYIGKIYTRLITSFSLCLSHSLSLNLHQFSRLISFVVRTHRAQVIYTIFYIQTSYYNQMRWNTTQRCVVHVSSCRHIEYFYILCTYILSLWYYVSLSKWIWKIFRSAYSVHFAQDSNVIHGILFTD